MKMTRRPSGKMRLPGRILVDLLRPHHVGTSAGIITEPATIDRRKCRLLGLWRNGSMSVHVQKLVAAQQDTTPRVPRAGLVCGSSVGGDEFTGLRDLLPGGRPAKRKLVRLADAPGGFRRALGQALGQGGSLRCKKSLFKK